MSKKLEKLREVNLAVNALITELETRAFVQNIGNVKSKRDVMPVNIPTNIIGEIKR